MIPISACANQPPECLRTCKVKPVIIQDKNLHPSRTGKAVVAHFEFLTAFFAGRWRHPESSRSSGGTKDFPLRGCVQRDTLGPLKEGGLFGMANKIQIHTKPLPGKAGFVTGTRRSRLPSYNSDYEPCYASMCVRL